MFRSDAYTFTPEAYITLTLLMLAVGLAAAAAVNHFGRYVGGRHSDPIGARHPKKPSSDETVTP